MDTVVDRLIRYAKVYSESDYHAGRTALASKTPGTMTSATSTPHWMPRQGANSCPPSA